MYTILGIDTITDNIIYDMNVIDNTTWYMVLK